MVTTKADTGEVEREKERTREERSTRAESRADGVGDLVEVAAAMVLRRAVATGKRMGPGSLEAVAEVRDR